MFPSFFYCLSYPPGSSRASSPQQQGTPVAFFILSNTTEILHIYLETAFTQRWIW